MTRVRTWLCIVLVTALAGCASVLQPVTPTTTSLPSLKTPSASATSVAGIPLPTLATASSTPTPSAQAATTPDAGLTGELSETPTGALEATATATAMGEVVAVALDQSRYNFGEPITVTIRNTLQVAIYGQTGQTFCDIVTAQRKEEGQWQDTGRCLAGAPPTFVELAPGSQAIARLQPRLPSDEPLAPGLYRISFPYTTDPQSGPWQTVYSREFVISSN